MVSGPPPAGVTGDREHQLAVLEAHLIDATVLNWSIDPPNVLRIGCFVLKGAPRVVALCPVIGWRCGVAELPFPQVAETWIEREQVVQSGRRGTRHPKDHDRPLDRCVGRRRMGGVPLLYLEVPDEALLEKGLDTTYRIRIVTDVIDDRRREPLKPFLPSVRPKIRQPGTPDRSRNEIFRCCVHGFIVVDEKKVRRASSAASHPRATCRRGSQTHEVTGCICPLADESAAVDGGAWSWYRQRLSEAR